MPVGRRKARQRPLEATHGALVQSSLFDAFRVSIDRPNDPVELRMDRKPHVAAGFYLGHINGPRTSRRPAHFHDIAAALPRIEQNRLRKFDLGVDAISFDQTIDLVRSAAVAPITGDPQDFDFPTMSRNVVAPSLACG